MKRKFLIYDIGYGDQGSEVRYSYYRYYICEGKNEEEAVKDWITQSPFDSNDVEKYGDKYLVCGGRSWLQIIELKEYSNEKEEPLLKWI
jgi:hypothetical protein